MYGVNY